VREGVNRPNISIYLDNE